MQRKGKLGQANNKNHQTTLRLDEQLASSAARQLGSSIKLQEKGHSGCEGMVGFLVGGAVNP